MFQLGEVEEFVRSCGVHFGDYLFNPTVIGRVNVQTPSSTLAEVRMKGHRVDRTIQSMGNIPARPAQSFLTHRDLTRNYRKKIGRSYRIVLPTGLQLARVTDLAQAAKDRKLDRNESYAAPDSRIYGNVCVHIGFLNCTWYYATFHPRERGGWELLWVPSYETEFMIRVLV